MKVLSAPRSSPYASAMVFKRHPEAEERRRSAVVLVKYLLAARRPEALPSHFRQLLSVLLWKITEAESTNKYNTRFKSEGARKCSDKTKLRHDHVFQRAKMIAALEKAAPHELDGILNRAVGCTVTVEEDRRLSYYKHYDGWERYREAKIVVYDMLTSERMNWPTP